jgi:hypothetical protein
MSRSDRDPLVASLLAAVAAAPTDIPLRLHVVGLLLERGRAAEALEHCSVVLRTVPTHAEALALLRKASGALADGYPTRAPVQRGETEPAGDAASPVVQPPDPSLADFDWAAAEAQVAGGGTPPEDVTGPDPAVD